MDFSNRFQVAQSSFPAEVRRNPSARKHHNNIQRRGGEGEGGQINPRRDRQIVYQPLNVHVRQVAKSYFKLMQAIHHKHIIDKAILTQTPPKGMRRQVLKLTAFIRPSSPTEELREAVESNTQTWLQNSLSILQDHYGAIIANHGHTTYNDTAFQVAENWLKKRYKARLAAGTLEAVRSLLTDNLEGSVISAPSSEVDSFEEETAEELLLDNEEEFPPLSQVNRLSRTSLYPAVQVTGNLTVRESQSTPLLDDPVPVPQFIKLGDTTQTNRVISPIDSDNVDQGTGPVRDPDPTVNGLLVPPRPPRDPLCPPSTSRPVLGLREEKRLGQAEVGPPAFQVDDDLVQPKTTWRKPNRINKSEIHVRPERQGSQSTVTKSHSFHHTKNVLSNVSVLQASPEIQTCSDELRPFNKTYSSVTRTLADNAGALPGGTQNLDLNPKGERSGSGQTKVVGNKTNMMMRGSVNHSVAEHQVTETSSEPKNYHLAAAPATPGSSRGTAPATEENERQIATDKQPLINRYRPTYHKARKGRKIVDWAFCGTRPIWFLGDSNLNRIPAFSNDNIQIDSYPGASFYHFLQILEKTPIHSNIKLVILSVGINNRDQDAEKTSIKQLRMLYKKAKSVFPNADVFFPLINFSPSLPKEQQRNLNFINSFAAERFLVLNPLPEDHFRTVGDNIHWTQDTARHIITNWCEQLHLDF